MLRPLQTHTSYFFNKYSLSLYVYTRGLLDCLLGCWPLGQTLRGQILHINYMTWLLTSDLWVPSFDSNVRLPTFEFECVIQCVIQLSVCIPSFWVRCHVLVSSEFYEIMWFFGRNAHDSGTDTWEKTLHKIMLLAWLPKLPNRVSM